MYPKRIYFVIISIIIIGLFAGILLPELLHMGVGSYTSLISIYGLQEFGTGNFDFLSLFPYIAGIRLQLILFLWMSCYTPMGLLFHMIYLFWLGMSAGLLLSVFALRHGYEGFILFLCCMFPQWLLYLVQY